MGLLRSRWANLGTDMMYGRYNAYCPEDHCEMENIGFYVESIGREDMPLGPTEEYALRK